MVEVSGGAATEQPSETTEIQTQPQQQPNLLDNKWAFWFDNQAKPKSGAAWGSSLRKAFTFDSIQDFWWYIYIIFTSSYIFFLLICIISLALVLYLPLVIVVVCV